MKKKFRPIWFLHAILYYVIFLIVGAITPFIKYKEIKKETLTKLTHDEIYSMQQSQERAKLLETNLSAWEERIRLLNMAEEEIILATFSMALGESTSDISSILLKKADLGVKVFILVDGFNGFLKMQGQPLFYALSSHPNIEIKHYNPINLLLPWKTQGRMHDKYVIVDKKAYILGGRNTFDYFIGDYEGKNKSYDREVLVYNTAFHEYDPEKSIYKLYDYFYDIWNGKNCKLFNKTENLWNKKGIQQAKKELYQRYEYLTTEYNYLFQNYNYIEHTYEVDGISLLSNPTDIYGKEPIVFYQLTELMKKAKNRVLIHTPYAVCNNYMYDRLREVHEAIPNCRMLLNSVENGDNFVASSDYLRNKKDLIKVGIPLYEYDGGISYHGKSIVIDDNISIIGSYNLDLRSTYLDTELMLVIKSEGLTKELSEYMEGFFQDCRHVLDEKEYAVPDHIVVKKIPFLKKASLKVVGFILQAFRFLV